MKSIIHEFKDFINRGNVIDLAVAVVIGAAFGAVITSFTNDIFGGVLGAIGGQPTVGDLSFTIGQGEIRWGAFLDAIINFLIVAFALFLVIKGINAAQNLAKRNATEEQADEEQTELELLREIRDALVRRD
jgi:large conductance mechanosensitive channel